MDHSVKKERQGYQQNQRVYKLLFLFGLLLVVGWLTVKGWRIARLARSLQANQEAAEVLTAQGLINADPKATETLILNVRTDVLGLKSELRPFMPLTPYLGWLPKVGPLITEAEPLLEMADAGTEAAAYTVRGLKPALILLQNENGSGEQMLPTLLPILEEAEPDLHRASVAMERVKAARVEISQVEQFPWQVRSLFEKLDSKLYLADILKLVPVLPELLGSEGERTYLIMAQNEDEIRATGGFVTGVGLLRVDQGQIVEMSFQDANLVDDWRNKPYDFPPEPLYKLMGLELFVFRDANYWPDFPTSAERALELYSYGQDLPPLDGAIAIDQQFVAKLVAVTGPVPVPSLELTVNNKNVISSLREAWGLQEGESVSEWVPNRKDFLGPFAQAVRAKLFDNLNNIDLLFLAQNMHEAAAGKHLQIYSRDQEVAAVLDQLNWDGQLKAPNDVDQLLVVDTNVGYNKVNPLIEQKLTYHVTLDENGSGVAELSLRYDHSGTERAQRCTQEVDYPENVRYEHLMNRCFWNYLRVYHPAGSQLLDASEHSLPEDIFLFSEGWKGGAMVVEEPGGRQAWANFFLLPPGESIVSNYRYQLPAVVTKDQEHQYQLYLFKQAGQAPQDVEIRITLPDGAEVISTTPSAAREAQTIVFKQTLNSDRVFTIRYR